jgi:GNAT superfamily N-acetyltransferase
MIQVTVPTSSRDLDDVRALMRAFNAWHRQRHPQDLHLIDAYFDAVAFERELASLRGKYHPPDGLLLLARLEDRAAGCVALRRIDSTACEMKRMFVYPEFHGRGVGKALGVAVVHSARLAGYRVMRLDTSIRQHEAQALYTGLGFRVIEPYYELPDDLRSWLVFMELTLAPVSADAP